MNKGDALILELDFTVNGEALQEGEWDDIELVLGSHSYTLSNGDIYWDGETYVVFLSQEDSFQLKFTNMYQLRLLKDGFVISSKPIRMKVGGCLSRVILGDEYGESMSRYNPLIDGSITKIVSNASTVRPYAFAFCGELETARFTEATSIGEYAFYSCQKLKTVKLDKATTIYGYAFKKNISSVLETVDAPMVTRIGQNAFEDSALKEINAPNLTSIGGSAFYGTSIEKAMFPKLDSITGDKVFYNCSNLEVADIGSVTAIDTELFVGCTSLNTLILRNSTTVTYIRNRTTMFDGSPFGADGSGGTVYVPSAMLESYTSDRSWNTIKNYNANNQILPIEGSIYE